MIDMHSHCFPRIARATAHAVDAERAPWLAVEPGALSGSIMLGERPFRPVQAFALPEFTTTTCACPRFIRAAHTFTGAAQT